MSSTARRMNPRISAPLRESRLPVGSSAKITSGRLASARATATRCCWPPDSSDGRCFSRGRRPTVSITRSSQPAVGLPAGQVDRQGDVLGRRQHRQQVEGLEDEPEAVAPQPGQLLVGQGGEVDVAHQDAPARQRVEPGHAVHEGRLARARRAHDGGEAPGGDGDVDLVERPHLGVARARRPWWRRRPGRPPPGRATCPTPPPRSSSSRRVQSWFDGTDGRTQGEWSGPASAGWGWPHPRPAARPLPGRQFITRFLRSSGAVDKASSIRYRGRSRPWD